MQGALFPRCRSTIFHNCQILSLRVADTVEILTVVFYELFGAGKSYFCSRRGTVRAGKIIPMLTFWSFDIKSFGVLHLSIGTAVRVASERRVRVLDELCDGRVYLAGISRIFREVPMVQQGLAVLWVAGFVRQPMPSFT